MNDDRIRLFDELNGSARSRGISEATRATRSGQIGEGKLGALPQEVVPEVHRRSAVALLFIVQQEVLQRTQTAQLGIHVSEDQIFTYFRLQQRAFDVDHGIQ